jgi:hypothetical protein
MEQNKVDVRLPLRKISGQLLTDLMNCRQHHDTDRQAL